MNVELYELSKMFKAEKKKVEIKMKQFARCINSIEYWILKGKLDELDYAIKSVDDRLNALEN